MFTFTPLMAGSLSPSVQQGSGAMQIEIRKGLALYPGTFNAVIAPEKEIITAINSNTDLQRFLFLYISGNYSQILSGINRQSKNFDVRRGFTAHQLFTILREAGYTVVFIEHDPSLFDGAFEMLEPIANALKELARESLVILYTPLADRTFSALARKADHYIEIVPTEENKYPVRTSRIMRQCGLRPNGQTTLEVS
jgi:DNA polymerase I